MKTFLLISPKNRTVYNFRGDLIKEIQKKGYRVVVTGPNRDNIDRIESLGVEFVEIPMNKDGINPVADLKYLRALYSLMRKIKPDATLGYTIKPVIYGAIAARMASVKNISSMITGAGFLFTSKTRKAKALKQIVLSIYKLALKCADHVIFQNEDDRKEFVASGLVKSSKTSLVNGSGVNMNHFVPAPLPDKTVFFMLGRLLYSKGLMEYLRAAEIIKAEYPDVGFRILGNIASGMQDAVPENIIKKYVDNQIVELLPETNDVRPAYAACSVFVLPSHREGTPRSVLEAESMGRPIITCDSPGCRSTVKDGYNGFLVPVGDVDALVKSMKFFIDNPGDISLMGENSVKYCKNKFDVNKVNAEMIDIMKL